MEALTQFDHQIFSLINSEWSNSAFDWLFPSITDFHKSPWFPFVLVPLLAFWVWKKRSIAIRSIVALILSIGLSDAISYRIIKPMVNRERPPASGITVQLRTHNHSGMSFPSNHSANIFAGATTLSFVFPILAPAFFTIAFLIGYSRIYVGVHFPLDVVAGAVLGISVALAVHAALRLFIRFKRGAGFFRARS